MNIKYFAAILVMSLTFPPPVLAEEAILEVRSVVPTWAGQAITLQDVLEDSPIKYQLQESVLKQLVIDGEEIPNENKNISSKVISKKLRNLITDKSVPGFTKFHFRLPSEISFQPLPLRYLENRLQSDLIRALQKTCGDCRAEVSKIQIQWPEDVTPDVKWQWESLPEIQSLRGSLFIGIDLTKGPVQHRRWLQARTRIFRKVPVATRAISYGERFEKANVEHTWRDVSHFPYEPLHEEDLNGFASNRLIPLGQIVRRRDLVKPQVIKHGDIVKVYRDKGSLEITAQGIAQQAGAIGESIRVKITPTDKLVSAQIEDRGRVRIR